jgi:hypothetical protein
MKDYFNEEDSIEEYGFYTGDLEKDLNRPAIQDAVQKQLDLLKEQGKYILGLT